MDIAKAEAALRAFVETVQATGGVVEHRTSGALAPVGDPDWIDLGEAYAKACDALGMEVIVADQCGDDDER